MVRRGDPKGATLVWCRKCSGHAVPLRVKADEPMQTRNDGHERTQKDVNTEYCTRRNCSGQQRERVER